MDVIPLLCSQYFYLTFFASLLIEDIDLFVNVAKQIAPIKRKIFDLKQQTRFEKKFTSYCTIFCVGGRNALCTCFRKTRKQFVC